jgi:signal transduction histidine kinase
VRDALHSSASESIGGSRRHHRAVLPDRWSVGVIVGVLGAFIVICFAQAWMATGVFAWPPAATVSMRAFGGAVALTGAVLAWTRFAARRTPITLLVAATLTSGAFFMLGRTVITLVGFSDLTMTLPFQVSIRMGWAQNVALPLILLGGVALIPLRAGRRMAAWRPRVLIALALSVTLLGAMGAWHPAFPGNVHSGALIARPDYAWSAALHLILLVALWERADLNTLTEGRWLTFAVYVSFLNQVLVLPFWPPGAAGAASALGALMNTIVYGIISTGLLVGAHASELAEERSRSEARRLEAERVRVERALALQAARLQKANEELTQYTYVASHDLQEPLRMVTSYLQLIERRYEGVLDEQGREFMRFAVDGAVRMKRLTTDLLAYSQVDGQRLEPHEVDLDDALRTALQNLEVAVTEAGATVTWDALPTVLGDHTQMVQLLQNLVSNAIKFARPQTPPLVHVSATVAGEEHIISVRDDGIGIEERYREKVFAVFQRLVRDDTVAGTGIGLALCRKIVQRHGGRIWFESTPGAGTTFFVALSAAGILALPAVEMVDDPTLDREVTTLIDRARELI